MSTALEVTEVPMLPKAQLLALEKVFEREIQGCLLQAKGKIYQKLAADGYLELVYQEFKDRYGILKFTGYALTHAGRIAYCRSCRGEEP